MSKKPKATSLVEHTKRPEVNIPSVKYGRDKFNLRAAQIGQSGEDKQELVPADENTTTATAAPTPQTLIKQTLEAINNEALRQFLLAVLQETEVRLVVSQFDRLPLRSGRRYRIEQLHHAGSIARFGLDWLAADKETLYVATLIRGIQELMVPQIVGNSCTPSHLMFSIVCSALHRLDDAAPRQAWLLRLALGWGNEDEVDAVLTPLIRHTVHKALSSVGLIHQPMALS